MNGSAEDSEYARLQQSVRQSIDEAKIALKAYFANKHARPFDPSEESGEAPIKLPHKRNIN